MSSQKICPQCGNEYPLDVRFCPTDGSTLRAQGGNDDLVGQIVADRYHVLRKLGEGGMGQVYLAEHVKMGRKSALKVMHPGMVHDPDAISRFNREASNASRITHPNVAAIYDFGETPDGLIYLAMEFVEGVPLTQIVERQGALPPHRVATIVRQTADALTVAHDMGIVHRDLKPDNIMVGRNRDGSDMVKVVDFGIAKATQNDAQKVTKTGLVVGTPEYMSPEQLAGDKLDGRSDIYSLGLVAFHLLTGRLPFPSNTVQESMIMRLTDRPRTLGEMKPDVAWPEDLQAVMDRVLARDAALRYQVAGEFGRDLEKVVALMPEVAIAEGGTMVMGAAGAGAGATAALPMTRVAGPASGPGATKVASPVSSPAARAQRSRTPLMAGGALAVVLAAGGAFFSMSRAGTTTVVSDSANAAANGVTRDTAPVGNGTQDSGSVTAPIGTNQTAPISRPSTPAPQREPGPTRNEGQRRDDVRQPDTRGGGTTTDVADRPVNPPPPTTPAFDARPRLDALRRRIEGSATSADMLRIVAELSALLAQITSRADSVEARALRAEARFGSETDEGIAQGCRELTALKALASGAQLAQVNASFSTFCQ